MFPQGQRGKSNEHKHIKTALKACGYPNWVYVKSTKQSRNNTQTTQDEERNKPNNVVILYVAGLSEKFRGIFSKHDILVHFRPCNTVKQKLVHLKDKTPKHKLYNVVYAVQRSEDCTDLYIGETKQPLHKHMAQHRKTSSSGQDSTVHLHLKGKGHSFEEENVQLLDRDDHLCKAGKAIT